MLLEIPFLFSPTPLRPPLRWRPAATAEWPPVEGGGGKSFTISQLPAEKAERERRKQGDSGVGGTRRGGKTRGMLYEFSWEAKNAREAASILLSRESVQVLCICVSVLQCKKILSSVPTHVYFFITYLALLRWSQWWRRC